MWDRLFGLFRTSRGTTPIVDVDLVDASVEIPDEIRRRLLLRSDLRPLLDTLRQYGAGRPGVTRESLTDWVVRDRFGRIVGGATATILDATLIALDVEIDRRHRRRGNATRLYEAMSAAGVDVEAGSDTSLRHGMLTPLGYAFQVGRRRKVGLQARWMSDDDERARPAVDRLARRETIDTAAQTAQRHGPMSQRQRTLP